MCQEYFYFFCRARQEGHCDSRHLPFGLVEDAVIEHYRTIQFDCQRQRKIGVKSLLAAHGFVVLVNGSGIAYLA